MKKFKKLKNFILLKNTFTPAHEENRMQYEGDILKARELYKENKN